MHSIPVHACPFPVKPVLQLQLNVVLVLEHTAFTSQSWPALQ